MNCIKKYNNKMERVGIADNPRNYYRIYFGLRKRKWWWYILFWSVVVILYEMTMHFKGHHADKKG